jgi:hypothetical protein
MKSSENLKHLNNISDNLINISLQRNNNKHLYNLVGGQQIDATSPDSLGGIVSDRINNVVSSFIKAFVHLADSFIPVFAQASLGNLADMPFKDIAPELEKNKQLIQFILNDPVTKKAFQELIKTYIEFLIELYKLNENEINELLDTFWEGINEFARRSGTGLSNSALNFIETALAEIPVVGGIIDLIISIMRGFNHFMLASSPIIENSLKGAATAKKMRDDVNRFYTDNVSKLENSMNNLNNVLNKRSLIQSPLQAPLKKQLQGGKNKRNKKHIKKTLKRIYNSISRFTRKR